MTKTVKHISLTASIILIGCFFLNFNELSIQSENSVYTSYDDSQTYGASTCILSDTSENICYSYTLRKKADYPFAGLTIKAKLFYDLSSFNTLRIHVLSPKKRRIHVFYALHTKDKKFLKFRASVECNPNQEVYEIPLNEFKNPTWWIKSQRLSKKDILSADLSKVESISFSNDLFSKFDNEYQICLKTIKLNHNNTIGISILTLVILLLNSFLYLIYRTKKDEIIIQYKASSETVFDQENMLNAETDQVVHFISENYNDSELSLRLIRKSLKIPENKISLLLKTRFELSYKDYILQIRVEEAKRLLSTTEMNIGEVTHTTGFGSSSTFNRVFKAYTGLTPKEYSESTKN